MPIKQLPAIGDSNWGTTLNNYITQTTDNTSGGGFNSFTNFADRPTNLTADDKGKTYLNTKSGNFHTWDGTKWVVNHTGDAINVTDFGAITGVNDTAVVQAAIDYCQGNGVSKTSKLFLPSGQYRFEVEMKGQEDIHIVGAGTGAFGSDTTVRALNDGGYAFTFHCTSNQSIENLIISGYSDIPGSGYVYNGIKCIPVPNIPQLSGSVPVRLKNIIIKGCNICLYKNACLFGKFEDCFFKGNIGVFNKGGGTLYGTLYSGFDQYNHCFWQGCEKACVYYNNAINVDENQTKFENCWFEGNPGIVCLARGTGTGLNSLKFSHCWFEANTSKYGQNINIEGIDYVCNEFYFDNSRGVIEHANLPNGVVLINQSYLKLDNVYGSIDGGNTFNKISVDSGSYLDCRDIGGDGFSGISTDFVADSSALYFQNKGRKMSSHRSKSHKPLITRKYFNLIPNGSMAITIPPNLVASTATAQLIRDDGLYNNSCIIPIPLTT